MGNNCSYNCCTKDEIPAIRKAQEVEIENVLNQNYTETYILPTTNRNDPPNEYNNFQVNQKNNKSLGLKLVEVPNETSENKDASQNLDIDMQFLQENEEKIIKLQAGVRGHLERKHLKDKDDPALKETNLIEKKEISNEKDKRRESENSKKTAKEEKSKKEYNLTIETHTNEKSGANNGKLGASTKVHGVPEGSEASKQILSTMNIDTPKDLPLIKFENGAMYTGSWQNGLREGYGTQKWVDGSYYEGHWKNDRACGNGKLIHSDGDIYEGNWLDDKASGYGTYMHKNAAKYVGEWKDDKQNGHGVETWPDGAKYEGNYFDGKKHGQGCLYFSDGSVYKGSFSKNDIDGFGIYCWPDGKCYEGEWSKNKMHGKGKLTWSDGRKYEGEFKEDKKSGQGVFEWGDGRKYIGGWQNGKQHGMATYYSANGEIRKGEWIEGKRINWIEIIKKSEGNE